MFHVKHFTCQRWFVIHFAACSWSNFLLRSLACRVLTLSGSSKVRLPCFGQPNQSLAGIMVFPWPLPVSPRGWHVDLTCLWVKVIRNYFTVYIWSNYLLRRPTDGALPPSVTNKGLFCRLSQIQRMLTCRQAPTPACISMLCKRRTYLSFQKCCTQHFFFMPGVILVFTY